MLDRHLVLPQLLAGLAIAEPDVVAMQDVDGRHETRRGLHEANLRWADAYRRLGVRPGDHVVTMLPNSFEAYHAWLGLAWLGATEVPVNTMYRGRMLHYLVEDSGAEVLVVSARYLPQLRDVMSERPGLRVVAIPDGIADVAELPRGAVPGEEFLAGAEPVDDLAGPDYWDVAAIIYTSGTTGPSKGVLMPWGTLWAIVDGLPDDFVGAGDGFYTTFPAYHMSGKYMLYQAAQRRARLVIRDQFSVQHFWDDVRRFEVDSAVLLGAMAPFLMQAPERPDDADSPLRNVGLVPVPAGVEEFKQRFGVQVATSYGMTEVGMPFASDGFELANNTSCGRLQSGWAGYEAQVVDEHDQPLPPNQPGELVIRAREPWVLNAGYHGKPEATAAAWRNGWFHTGDAFVCDEHGNYYFFDRIKDAIRRRGENISSFEVEALVNEHPEVVECAAIAVPSEHSEDEVKVCVVRREGSTLTEAELIEFLAPRMPRFMVPRYVQFLDALPKTEGTMRTRKFELRAASVDAQTWDREAVGMTIEQHCEWNAVIGARSVGRIGESRG